MNHSNNNSDPNANWPDDQDDFLFDEIATSLRKAYQAPPCPDLDSFLPPVSVAKPSILPKNIFQLAACGLFLLVSVYLLVAAFGKRPFQGTPFTQTNLATLYGQAVTVGFHPDQEIKNPTKLAEFVSKKLNTSIALQDAGLNSRFLGTIHLGGISHKTATIMAMVEDEPVLLFFDDRQKAFDECIVHGNSTIQIFERKFEDVIAFEVTPHAKPSLLSLVSDSP